MYDVSRSPRAEPRPGPASMCATASSASPSEQPNRAQPDEREGTGPLPVGPTALRDRRGRRSKRSAAVTRSPRASATRPSPATAFAMVTGSSVGVRAAPRTSARARRRCHRARTPWWPPRSSARGNTPAGERRCVKDALGQATSEDQVAAQPPVHPQRPGQPPRAGGVACGQAALDGGGEVGVFEVDARQGLHLAAVSVARSQLLGDGQEVCSVGRGSALPLAGLPQPIAGVLRHGFEQSLPRAADTALG